VPTVVCPLGLERASLVMERGNEWEESVRVKYEYDMRKATKTALISAMVTTTKSRGFVKISACSKHEWKLRMGTDFSKCG
jgi:hypothetical protein